MLDDPSETDCVGEAGENVTVTVVVPEGTTCVVGTVMVVTRRMPPPLLLSEGMPALTLAQRSPEHDEAGDTVAEDVCEEPLVPPPNKPSDRLTQARSVQPNE